MGKVPSAAMFFILILCVSGIFPGTSATAKNRETPELDPNCGAIGVTIQSRGPAAMAARPYASMAFFVKADEGVDLLHATEVLPSNFSDGRQVYLLNVPPGKYVVVGAYTPEFSAHMKNLNDTPSSSIYFDQSMISATEATVQAGQITFAGEIIVKVSVGMKHADEAQTHYGQLIGKSVELNVDVNIGRDITTTSFAVGHLTRAGTLQSLDRDPQTEREFWMRAIKSVLKGESDWQDLARRRLEAMK